MLPKFYFNLKNLNIYFQISFQYTIDYLCCFFKLLFFQLSKKNLFSSTIYEPRKTTTNDEMRFVLDLLDNAKLENTYLLNIKSPKWKEHNSGEMWVITKIIPTWRASSWLFVYKCWWLRLVVLLYCSPCCYKK